MADNDAETPCIRYKEFKFGGSGELGSELLCVSIPEVLDPHYGMYVWPSAVVLAQYLWKHREELRHRTILELGAGASLPGVVAARCGSKVILSDCSSRRVTLQNCRRSCDANGLKEVQVLGLTWGDVSPNLVLLPQLDLILGSDVFYEPRDFEDVLVTVAFLLRKNPTAQFWTTYQDRSADWSLEVLLHRWNLTSTLVPLESFQAHEPDLAGSSLPGRHSVQMIIITLKTHQDPEDPPGPGRNVNTPEHSITEGEEEF